MTRRGKYTFLMSDWLDTRLFDDCDREYWKSCQGIWAHIVNTG